MESKKGWVEAVKIFQNTESYFNERDKKNVYPQIGVSVFRIWIIILAFVGIQLAWNLRPFLHEKNEEFKLFRKYEGNFYTAIIYSAKHLFTEEDNPENYKMKELGNSSNSAENEQDSTDVLNYFK